MILESLVTTLDEQGHINLAPLGPIVLPPQSPCGLPQFLLRPYEGSTTCENLLASGNAVIHVIDDALLITKTAIGKVDANDLVVPIPGLEDTHVRLKRCHRWFAVRVTQHAGTPPRHELTATCLDSGLVDPFFGFNRAKHAVIEAAVAATRLHLLPPEEIEEELERARIAIEKTGGEHEREALQLIRRHVSESSIS
ncbi:DUF447 domain-containing protein [Rhodopirellula baltica]|uniref:Protein containing DUF447 n=1 Tax=Rhodopirellula baltica WH47 TaxID=991778 RepID=F2AUY3_RHOBT|nr:DUF447 domain-containing protein [Rhodopirellula baltica]EGF26527.1 protein containing DUF447 [Rhodopirellula baltica WH47]